MMTFFFDNRDSMEADFLQEGKGKAEYKCNRVLCAPGMPLEI